MTGVSYIFSLSYTLLHLLWDSWNCGFSVKKDSPSWVLVVEKTRFFHCSHAGPWRKGDKTFTNLSPWKEWAPEFQETEEGNCLPVCEILNLRVIDSGGSNRKDWLSSCSPYQERNSLCGCFTLCCPLLLAWVIICFPGAPVSAQDTSKQLKISGQSSLHSVLQTSNTAPAGNSQRGSRETSINSSQWKVLLSALNTGNKRFFFIFKIFIIQMEKWHSCKYELITVARIYDLWTGQTQVLWASQQTRGFLKTACQKKKKNTSLHDCKCITDFIREYLFGMCKWMIIICILYKTMFQSLSRFTAK